MEMETRLQEAMASGVLVDVRDGGDHSIGQAVYLDWHGRPVPAVGDTMTCEAVQGPAGRPQRILGRVRSRHFDVQRDETGATCVWVRVILDAQPRPAGPPRAYRPRFSAN
jgi:hypothetical protein